MCYELSCLLQGHPNQPELLTCGCGSTVAAADHLGAGAHLEECLRPVRASKPARKGRWALEKC